MATKLENAILAKHLAENMMLSKVISSLFEEISVLKERKHVDNSHMLSLMLEFIGPFKKHTVTMADHPDVKQAQKRLKTAVSMASKAASGLKSLDLTSVGDVGDKLGALVSALLQVNDIENEIGNMEEIEPKDVVTPDMQKAIATLYGLAAYNLNAVKSLIDKHVSDLKRAISPEALKAAMGHAQDAELSGMKKKIMTPWHKQIGSFASSGLNGAGMGAPGGMRLRAEDTVGFDNDGVDPENDEEHEDEDGVDAPWNKAMGDERK
jgi:hypothetical protein